MDEKQRAAALAAQMTLEEKAALCSGLDFWHTKPIPRLGLPSAALNDGPHGLRKQLGSQVKAGIGPSEPATCFAPACTSACSFDPALLRQMGQAMAQECIQQGVALLLGPGANIKRSPLCGRNFEYFSEDPLLSGVCAAAVIAGIEGEGVGACLKHFAANNQEAMRLVSDSVVDERALREIYLAPFELAVRQSRPAAVMCSYNLVNGTYSSDNKRLLTHILRQEWGFEGLVVSDWGATNLRAKALAAGLDLEMPGPDPENDDAMVHAVRSGMLPEEVLTQAAARVARVALRGAAQPAAPCDMKAHHQLAVRLAAESAVLLQNNGVLPLGKAQRVALIGSFAKHPRYQGAGSSQIEPTWLCSLYQSMQRVLAPFEYAPGYSPEQRQPDPRKEAEALRAAGRAQVVVLVLGLPASLEAEGADRQDLRLPPCQLALAEALLATGKPVVILLAAGGCVELPFAPKAAAVLLLGLGGQGGGEAARQLLYGQVNPSGKLAETWPLALQDGPCTQFGTRRVEYRESLYVGYRWYDSARLPVRWPFGHGLSYTQFEYGNLTLSAGRLQPGQGLTVRLTLKNTGPVAGKEVVQAYLAPPAGPFFRPAQALAGFVKVELAPGQEAPVALEVPARAFQVYDPALPGWRTLPGEYTLRVGASSRDLRLEATVELAPQPGLPAPRRDDAAALPYYAAPTAPAAWPQQQWQAVLGRPLGPQRPLRPFGRNSTPRDLCQRRLGRVLWALVELAARGRIDAPDPQTRRLMMDGMLRDMPLRALAMMTCGRLALSQIDGLAQIFNGQYRAGLKKLCRRPKALPPAKGGPGGAP